MASEHGDRQTVASLGCGTLIIIALIVLFFSGGDTTRLEQQVAELQDQVETMQRQQEDTHRLVETLVLALEPGKAERLPESPPAAGPGGD